LVNVATYYDYVILTAGNANHALLIVSIDEDNNYLKTKKNSQNFVASTL